MYKRRSRTETPDRDRQYPAKFTESWDSPWGHYHPSEPPIAAPRDHIRTVLFTSCPLAPRVFRDVLSTPGVTVQGLVTDDVIDPRARIGKRRRIWRHLSGEQQRDCQTSLESLALDSGVPVFTGSVKSTVFTSILRDWDPDLIIVYVLGQLIPAHVFNYPHFGTYNFHPSNLTIGEFRGVAPLESAMAAGRSMVPTSCHLIDETFDTGPVVGVGGHTRIIDGRGEYLAMIDMLGALGPEGGRMASSLAREIVRRRAVIHELDFATTRDRAAE